MPNLLDRRPASMRSVKTDSAASRGTNEWDQISWPIVYYRERRLQTRIAKATCRLVQQRVYPCLSRMRGQLACPVLRGARVSNGSRLLDSIDPRAEEGATGRKRGV